MPRQKYQLVETYRGYRIERREDLKRRPYRVEVPGRDPQQPGRHADAQSVKRCKRFIDQALAALGSK